MEIDKVVYILIIGAIIIYVIIKAYKLRITRCPDCGGKMVLSKLEDPMGFNVSKKVTVSFFNGPRKYKEIWVCETCKHKIEKQYWGS